MFKPHVHESWGYNPEQGFATALEAQYSNGMCEQLVRVFDEICLEKGVRVQPADYKPPRVDKQPRGRTTPQLIPEYEKVCGVFFWLTCQRQMRSVACVSFVSMFQQVAACCVPRRRAISFCVLLEFSLTRNVCRFGQDCVAPFLHSCTYAWPCAEMFT